MCNLMCKSFSTFQAILQLMRNRKLSINVHNDISVIFLMTQYSKNLSRFLFNVAYVNFYRYVNLVPVKQVLLIDTSSILSITLSYFSSIVI